MTPSLIRFQNQHLRDYITNQAPSSTSLLFYRTRTSETCIVIRENEQVSFGWMSDAWKRRYTVPGIKWRDNQSSTKETRDSVAGHLKRHRTPDGIEFDTWVASRCSAKESWHLSGLFSPGFPAGELRYLDGKLRITREIVGSKRYRSKIRRNPPPPWNYIVKRYDAVQQTRCWGKNTVAKKILGSFTTPKYSFRGEDFWRISTISADIAFNATKPETYVCSLPETAKLKFPSRFFFFYLINNVNQ